MKVIIAETKANCVDCGTKTDRIEVYNGYSRFQVRRCRECANNPKQEENHQSHKSETGHYYNEPGSYGANP